MPAHPITDEKARWALAVWKAHRENAASAARSCGVSRPTFQHWIAVARTRGLEPAERTDGPMPPSTSETIQRDVREDHLRGEAKRYRDLYRRIREDHVEEERLIQLFTHSIQSLKSIPPAARAPRPLKPSQQPWEVPVLLLSDLQIGEVISLEETYGINCYDFGVFLRRLEYLEARVIQILTRQYPQGVPELVIASLGDNVSGLIHEELEKGGAQHVIDQTYLGALSVALFLARLRHHAGCTIRMVAVSGNHGRLKKGKPEWKAYFKNFDYLFNSIVATVVKDLDGIEVVIPKCLFAVVDVAGQRILMSHGHELPPSSLGIPLYSINRASAHYQELLSIAAEDRFQHWVMGHFHRPLELDTSIVNGTMAGLSEYGIGKWKPIRPMQRLMAFAERHGKAWEYPIWLNEAPSRSTVYAFEPDMATRDAIALFDDARTKS